MLYVGSAKSLKARVGDELGWIAGHETTERWSVTVVHMLKVFDAAVSWVATDTHEDAVLLERRLIEWHRTYVRAWARHPSWSDGMPRSGARERWLRCGLRGYGFQRIRGRRRSRDPDRAACPEIFVLVAGRIASLSTRQIVDQDVPYCVP